VRKIQNLERPRGRRNASCGGRGGDDVICGTVGRSPASYPWFHDVGPLCPIPSTKKKSAHDVVVIMMSATQGFGGMY
jgi:hypothetical protein